MDQESTETPYYYAGWPHAIVYLIPVQRGVRIGMTFFDAEGEANASCVMSLNEFRELLADGQKVIADVNTIRTNATTLRKDENR